MAPRHLYLVRHGQKDPAQDNFDNLGGGLTQLGREQAGFAAQRLSHLPIAIIHTSSLRRAAQTAGIIALQFPGVPIKPARLLWECIPYMPKKFLHWYKAHAIGLQQGQINVPPQFSSWLVTMPTATSLEKIEAGFAQAERAYARYFKPARTTERHEIIVCHGNLIRYFVTRALAAPPDSWLFSDSTNCGLSEIIIDGRGAASLLSHNDTGHIPADKRTFL